jgi:parallel beta-helix repeat protein
MMNKPIISIFICMLMMLGALTISTAAQNQDNSQPLTMGNTLYVGGSGPGNYSKIQDAINDATTGDTVFVYDDSSPYYENIVIEKSIRITGENKETTVILGDESADMIIVNISAGDMSFSGFTIQPSTGRPEGIQIVKGYTYPDYWNIDVLQNVSITNNIIKKTGRGIIGVRLDHGTIAGNTIEHCNGEGILLFISSNTVITNNIVSSSSYRGIEIDGLWGVYRIQNLLNPVPENNTISQNTVQENRWGIELNSGATHTKITDNNILDNYEVGIQIVDAMNTEIKRNNFIGNTQNAYFMSVCVMRYPRLLFNTWDGNYWDESKILPVPIPGDLWFMPFPRLPISISFPHFSLTQWQLKWTVFDKHPAQEPYDLP